VVVGKRVRVLDVPDVNPRGHAGGDRLVVLVLEVARARGQRLPHTLHGAMTCPGVATGLTH